MDRGAQPENYESLLTAMHGKNELKLETAKQFRSVLANIDRFEGELESKDHLDALFLGRPRTRSSVLTLEAEPAFSALTWIRFLLALGRLGSIKRVTLNADSVDQEAMVTSIRILSKAERIFLLLPLKRSRKSDVQDLVGAVSSHPCENFHIELCDHKALRSADPSVELSNRLQGDDSLSRLLLLDNVTEVGLSVAKLTEDECTSFSGILSSSRIRVLYFRHCTFPNEGGDIVARAIGKSRSISNLFLHDMMRQDDKTFCDQLLKSLPSNTSIRHLKVLYSNSRSCLAREGFVFRLMKEIALKNKKLRKLEITATSSSPQILCQDQMKEVQDALANNFSLRQVLFRKTPQFEMITALNAAGRGYLQRDDDDDAAMSNRAMCIEVLSKVKDNLDCLYYHIRENPILFCGNNNNNNNYVPALDDKAAASSASISTPK